MLSIYEAPGPNNAALLMCPAATPRVLNAPKSALRSCLHKGAAPVLHKAPLVPAYVEKSGCCHDHHCLRDAQSSFKACPQLAAP